MSMCKYPLASLTVVLTLCSLFLGSCSEDSLFSSGDSSISFRVDDDVAFSRGTPITSAVNIPNMCVYGYYTGDGDADTWANKGTTATPDLFTGVTVTNTPVDGSAVWSYPEKIYWPAASGAKVSFFAYSPVADGNNGITVTNTTGTPTLRYIVPATVTAHQPDLMVATPVLDKTTDSNPVSLSMRHALTCVGFQAKGYGTIKSISISGISLEGTLSLDGTSWTGLSAPSTSTFVRAGISSDNGLSDEMSSGLTATDGYLMMIPQTLTESAKVTVSFVEDGRDDVVIPLYGSWEAGQRITYNVTTDTPSAISVSPSAMTFSSSAVPASSAKTLAVTCGASDPWTLTSSDSWVTLSLSPDGSNASSTVSGTGPKTVYLLSTANGTGSSRSTTITYFGSVVSTITQLGSSLDPGSGAGTSISSSTHTYVGAFWKHDQVGERLIRIPVNSGAAGAWTAFVYYMDGSWSAGDIILNNANLPTYPADASASTALGRADTDPVSGTATSVSGTASTSDPIYFRIGLKSAFTPTDAVPARYAIVAITYAGNNNIQLLYLRQGEDPDYLMRPTDGYGNTQSWASSPTWRPEARKFSAYNVTAATLNAQCDRARTATNPSIFTAFPSQAGAFFQWTASSSAVTRFAYSPVGSFSLPITNASGYWSTLSSTNETSPQDYLLSSGSTKSFRRLNDGSTSGDNSAGNVQGSEFRQSLWYSPQTYITNDTGNSLFGYYADGYFDRLATASSQNSQANSCVNSSDAAVAYVGNLFFNPLSGASLFFPSAGYLSSSNLYSTGSNGDYWSSSAYNTSFGWYLSFNSGNAYHYYTNRNTGFGVRPVLE